jgi:hypothetical protein
MITFRPMNEDDIEAVYKICALLADEDKEEFDENDLRNTIEKTFSQGILKAWLAACDGQIIGGIGFYVMPSLLKYAKTQASEAFWYVIPKYRKGTGNALLKHAEQELYTNDIDFGLKDDRLVDYMYKKGYTRFKTIVRKHVR